MACPSHLLTSGPKPIGQLTALLDLSKWQHFEGWLAPCKPAFFFVKSEFGGFYFGHHHTDDYLHTADLFYWRVLPGAPT